MGYHRTPPHPRNRTTLASRSLRPENERLHHTHHAALTRRPIPSKAPKTHPDLPPLPIAMVTDLS